jgi:hypothetical protein
VVAMHQGTGIGGSKKDSSTHPHFCAPAFPFFGAPPFSLARPVGRLRPAATVGGLEQLVRVLLFGPHIVDDYTCTCTTCTCTTNVRNTPWLYPHVCSHCRRKAGRAYELISALPSAAMLPTEA